MRHLITIGALGLAGLWVLVGVAGWFVAGALGDWLVVNADLFATDPAMVVWLSSALDLARDVAMVLLAVLWVAVLAAILLGAAFGGALASRFGRRKETLHPLPGHRRPSGLRRLVELAVTAFLDRRARKGRRYVPDRRWR